MITEKEKEEIKQEAKNILDRFASALEKVKVKEKRLKREVGGFREESIGEKCDGDFRRSMFSNAPEVRSDCIIAEKKKW